MLALIGDLNIGSPIKNKGAIDLLVKQMTATQQGKWKVMCEHSDKELFAGCLEECIDFVCAEFMHDAGPWNYMIDPLGERFDYGSDTVEFWIYTGRY